MDALVELFDWILDGGLLSAHNAMFETAIWANVAVPKHGWPDLPRHQIRCTAAKAAAHALPRSLDEASAALGLKERKDAEGHKLMMKLSRPRKPRKAERAAWEKEHGSAPMPVLYHESREQFERLYAYCRQDVIVEDAVSQAVPDLSESETELYLLDQRVNERGFLLDMEAVSVALELIEQETTRLNGELKVLTGGSPDKASQRKKLHDWFLDHWVVIEDTKSGSVEEALTRSDLPPKVRRGLELLQLLGKSSTAKYERFRDWACGDNRVRGGLLYHGASTGRWCLTGDHEVLTRNGWVCLDAWSGGDIACWNTQRRIAFLPAVPVSFVFSGDLYHHESKRIDQLATAEHTLPVYTDSGIVPMRVSEMNRKDVAWTGCIEYGDMQDDHRLRVLVMAQADGYFNKKGALLFHFRKARKIERCQMLLQSIDVPYRVREESDGSTHIIVYKYDVPEWLRAFGDTSKTFDWSLLDCNLDVLFEELEMWDAYRAGPVSVQYSTVNAQNADIIQTVAHLSGRAVSVTSRKQKVHHRMCHSLSIWLNPGSRHELEKATVTAFKGTVYCAETTTGFFLVRRNGKIWVTGNSGQGPQVHNLPRGSVRDIESAWTALKTKNKATIEAWKSA